jgi:hypothetical protein
MRKFWRRVGSAAMMSPMQPAWEKIMGNSAEFLLSAASPGTAMVDGVRGSPTNFSIMLTAGGHEGARMRKLEVFHRHGFARQVMRAVAVKENQAIGEIEMAEYDVGIIEES